jgi:hypothetical protein
LAPMLAAAAITVCSGPKNKPKAPIKSKTPELRNCSGRLPFLEHVSSFVNFFFPQYATARKK